MIRTTQNVEVFGKKVVYHVFLTYCWRHLKEFSARLFIARHPSFIFSLARETPGGGYLVERWVRGCAAQIGCFFGLSGLAMAPFCLA